MPDAPRRPEELERLLACYLCRERRKGRGKKKAGAKMIFCRSSVSSKVRNEYFNRRSVRQHILQKTECLSANLITFSVHQQREVILGVLWTIFPFYFYFLLCFMWFIIILFIFYFVCFLISFFLSYYVFISFLQFIFYFLFHDIFHYFFYFVCSPTRMLLFNCLFST